MTNTQSPRQIAAAEPSEFIRRASLHLVSAHATATVAAPAEVEASLTPADRGLRRRRTASSVSESAAHTALRQLDLNLTDDRRSLRRCWTDLVQLQLVGGTPEQPVVDWNLAVELGQGVTGTNYSLCAEIAREQGQPGAARLVLDAAASDFAAAAADPFESLMAVRSPALITALLREARRRADREPAEFEAATLLAADRIRSRAVAALRSHADALPDWLRWCVDAAVEPTMWPSSVSAAALAQTGRQLLSCVVEPTQFAIPKECVIDAVVLSEQRCTDIAATLAVIPRDDKRSWCEYLPPEPPQMAPVQWSQVITQMALGATIQVTGATLASFARPVPWTMVAAILRDDCATALLELALRKPDEWFGFDSPDEGEVGQHLVRLMILDGSWNDHWKQLVVETNIDEDELAYIESSDSMALWSEFGSPDRVRQELPNPTATSSYSHGLNDVIAEAYGDVWSPRDPFSTRGPNPKADPSTS